MRRTIQVVTCKIPCTKEILISANDLMMQTYHVLCRQCRDQQAFLERQCQDQIYVCHYENQDIAKSTKRSQQMYPWCLFLDVQDLHICKQNKTNFYMYTVFI